MNTLGMIGGMSWEATDLYYQGINRGVYASLGELHSADILMRSVNFHNIEPMMRNHQWDEIGVIMARHAKTLQDAGAQAIVLTTNTVHKTAPAIEAAISVPFMHIIDCTANRLPHHKTIGLLGTQYTMSDGFYHTRMRQFDKIILTPDAAAQSEIDRIIFDELCQGKIYPQSRETLMRQAQNLIDQGAEAIILGCTELVLSLGQNPDLPVTVIDSTQAHIDGAIQFLLN